MKISRPIKISIAPPKIEALEENFVPKCLPNSTPKKQHIKVTKAITETQTKACKKIYSAIVKPTERASIEVATA